MPKDELKSLSVKTLETVHVTHNDQKIIALAIVLKDTVGNHKMWNELGILNRLVITDVQIKPGTSNVDLLVRNVNVKETVELVRNGIISGHALHASLGDTIRTLLQLPEGENNSFMDMVEKESNSEQINLEDFWNNIGPVTDVLLANIHTIPEVEDQTVYKISVPLVEAHLAQVLYAKSNSPAFVIVDDLSFKEMKEAQKDNNEDMYLGDFTILDYPLLGSSEYYGAIAGLIQKVEGYYPLNVSPERARELRGEVLSLVINLSKGSADSLVRAFGYLNPIKNGLNAYTKRKATGTSNFTQSHVDMVYFAECVERIYQYLAPSAIAAIIQQQEDNNDYYETASLVDDLFDDAELLDSFAEILGEMETQKLDNNSSVEEIIEFYSADLWGEVGFPTNMVSLIPKIDLPLFTENNLMRSAQNVEETPSNVGSLVIAKLIAAAARYNRLIQITEATPVSLNPIGCLVQGLTYPDELEIWTVVESVRRLHLPGGLQMFSDIYTSGLTNPNLDQKFSGKANLVESGLTNVLHRLGHVLLEEFSLEEALELMPSNESLSHYVDALYNPANPNDLSEEEEEGNLCPPLEATLSVYDDIDFKYEGDDYVDAIGKYILSLADFKAGEMFQKNPEVTRKDKSWIGYVDRWLTLLIAPFPNG